jgi:hypothetical protein
MVEIHVPQFPLRRIAPALGQIMVICASRVIQSSWGWEMETPNLTDNKRGNSVRSGRFARQIMAIIKVRRRATNPPPQPNNNETCHKHVSTKSSPGDQKETRHKRVSTTHTDYSTFQYQENMLNHGHSWFFIPLLHHDTGVKTRLAARLRIG